MTRQTTLNVEKPTGGSGAAKVSVCVALLDSRATSAATCAALIPALLMYSSGRLLVRPSSGTAWLGRTAPVDRSVTV